MKSKSSLPSDFPSLADLIVAKDYWQKIGRADLKNQVGEIAAEFRGHHEACGNRFISWPAAWKTWYVRAVRFSKKPKGEGSIRMRGPAFKAIPPDQTRVTTDMLHNLAQALRRREG